MVAVATRTPGANRFPPAGRTMLILNDQPMCCCRGVCISMNMPCPHVASQAASWSTSPTTTLGPSLLRPTRAARCAAPAVVRCLWVHSAPCKPCLASSACAVPFNVAQQLTVCAGMSFCFATGHPRGRVVEGPAGLPAVGRALPARRRHCGPVQRGRAVGGAVRRVRIPRSCWVAGGKNNAGVEVFAQTWACSRWCCLRSRVQPD